MSEATTEARRLHAAAWGSDAAWTKESDPSAYYEAGRAESAFNLWCYENLPVLLDSIEALEQALQDKKERDQQERFKWRANQRIQVLEQALQDYVAEVAYNRWVERFEGILGDGAKR